MRTADLAAGADPNCWPVKEEAEMELFSALGMLLRMALALLSWAACRGLKWAFKAAIAAACACNISNLRMCVYKVSNDEGSAEFLQLVYMHDMPSKHDLIRDIGWPSSMQKGTLFTWELRIETSTASGYHSFNPKPNEMRHSDWYRRNVKSLPLHILECSCY